MKVTWVGRRLFLELAEGCVGCVPYNKCTGYEIYSAQSSWLNLIKFWMVYIEQLHLSAPSWLLKLPPPPPPPQYQDFWCLKDVLRSHVVTALNCLSKSVNQYSKNFALLGGCELSNKSRLECFCQFSENLIFLMHYRPINGWYLKENRFDSESHSLLPHYRFHSVSTYLLPH